jgi:eukaryotic-like serine/threonine-protein kinase
VRTCPSAEQLHRLILEDLPPAEASDLDAHVQDCPGCQRVLDELTADPLVPQLRFSGSLGRSAILHICAGHAVPAPEKLPLDGDDRSSGDGDVPTENHCAPGRQIEAGSGETPVLDVVGESWGEFRIVRELGQGGMGVVYEAYQGSLKRHVALKILPDRGDAARFRREAKAAGRLHHTNIVPVFGVGEHQGRAYYVMQYIAGRSLDRVLKERAGTVPSRFDDREMARLGVQVAEALAYAHAQGVIHRDIKPSNLLLDERDTVWITDFGLAYDASDTHSLTSTGDFLGTLRYVAPERFSERGDERADIYGLGVTLYELISGRPAYADGDHAVLIHQILNQEPVPPRQVDRRIARDLETIVLKAMARDPEQRYATAEALAEDLRRFLADRTILARRVGAWERLRRWARRNKVVAGLLAALVAVFLAGFVGVTVQWRRANDEAIRANRLAKAESVRRIQAQAEIASRDFDKGVELTRKGDVDYGLLWMAEALTETPPERAEVARVARMNLAAWEGQMHLRRAVLEHPTVVYHARFRPDGRAILTHGDEKAARLWDVVTGRPLVPPMEHPDKVDCIAFSPDGRLIATGCDDRKVRIWDTVTGRPFGKALDHGEGRGEPIAWVEFSPDGRLLLSRDFLQTTRLWEIQTGRRIELPREADTSRFAGISNMERDGLLNFYDNTNRVALFSPDGGRLLLLDRANRRVRTFDIASGTQVGPPIAGEGLAWVSFSPDGRLIGTGDRGRTAQLWDAATGREVASLSSADGGFLGATFSPDSQRLLVLSENSAQLWDVADGRPVWGPLRHEGRIRVGAFSPDGRLIVTASDDHTARVWDAATGELIGSPLRHEREVWDASFSPDGRLIVTASLDGTAQLWELSRGDLAPIGQRTVRPNRRVDGITGIEINKRVYKRLCHATIDREGSRVLISGDHMARLVEVDTGEPIGRPMTQQDWLQETIAAFSPDGRRIATANRDVVLYEVGNERGFGAIPGARNGSMGRSKPLLLPHLRRGTSLAFSPDGKVLATTEMHGTVLLWDTGTGTRIGQPFDAGMGARSMAFSPDGRLLAVGTGPAKAQALLWDLAAGRARGDAVRFKDGMECLAFSPDGSALAAGSADGSFRVIDTVTGLVRVDVHPGGILKGVAFSPDGRLMLTTSHRGDMTDARLWDARTGAAASPVMTYPDRSQIPAIFKPDGSAFAAPSADHTIRLWDVATAKPLGVVGTLRNECFALAFRPDGRSLVAVELPGIVHKWPIPEPSVRTIADLVQHVQLRTDRELDPGKSPVALSPERRRQLRAEGGDAPLMPETTDEAAWHEAIARDAEAAGDSFGLRWRLDRLIAAQPDDGLLHARRARAALWADDVASAEADLEQAIALGPRDRILDWMLHRAEDFRYEGRPADALRLLDRIITVRPDDWLTYAQRAEMLPFVGRDAEYWGEIERARARGGDIAFLIRIADERSRAGRWAEAVPLWDRAIALQPVPYCVWQWATIAHLEMDDEDGYRRVCQIVRDRHPGVIDEQYVSEYLASVLSLGPGAVGDDGKALGWIEPLPAAIDPADRAFKRQCLRTLGAVLYRLGRYREAIDRIEEGIAVGGRSGVPPEEAIFLAMAHFRIGDTDKARSLLASPWDDESDRRSVEPWWADRHLRLLRSEAARLILDPSFPTDPFAP